MSTEAAIAQFTSNVVARPRLTVTDALIYAWLASLPLVNVLAPAAWFIPPMSIGLALTAWLIRRNELRLDLRFVALMILSVLCFLPWLFSAEYISLKTAFHAGALVASITVYYLAVRTALGHLVATGRAASVIRTVYYSLLVVSAFILLEFVGANTGAWNVEQFVPYIDVVEFEAAAFGIVMRARGFASEPGVMALFYDFALFFVLPVVATGWRWRLGYVAIILPAYFCLVSTASLVCVGVAAMALLIWRLRARFLSAGARLLAIAIITTAALIAAGDEIIEVMDTVIITKVGALFSGSSDDYSASDRRGRLDQVFAVTAEHPFGIGFGVAAGLDSSGVNYRGLPIAEGQVSLFATILLAGGVLALMLFVTIVVQALWQSFNAPRYGPYIAAGGLAISLHHLSITEFWLPFFWLFLACASAFHEERAVEAYASK